MTKCHEGSDGLVRVVTIQTTKSEYKRPLEKICILPIETENQKMHQANSKKKEIIHHFNHQDTSHHGRRRTFNRLEKRIQL